MTVSIRRIWGVAAAAAVVLVLLWYVAIFRPENHHLTAAHKADAAAQAQITQLQQQVTKLEALKRQIPADNAKLSTLDAAVPATPDLKDVLDQLHNLATTTGCELTAVNPASSGSSSAPASGPQSLSLTMSVSGSYPQLMAFFSGLSHLPRAVVVDGASIGQAGGGLEAQITSQIFYSS